MKYISLYIYYLVGSLQSSRSRGTFGKAFKESVVEKKKITVCKVSV